MIDEIAIEKIHEERDKIKHKLESLCYAVFHCTPQGKELLDLLERCYIIETPVCFPTDNPNRAFYREGENNLIRTLKSFVKIHANTLGESK